VRSSIDPRARATTRLSDVLVDAVQYERLKRLGSGTYGVVYLARAHGNDPQQFALKIMQNQVTRLYDQKLFMREVETLLCVAHPCVLKLSGWTFRCSSVEDVPAILTEFMANGPIEDLLQAQRSVDPERKLIYLYGVAEGLRYLHDELDIVHRDLKPANVMLNENDEPVVGDFGLAKIARGGTLRQTVVNGSPVYMAPELARDLEHTASVDVYAYAIMAWEIVTGSMAFEDLASTDALRSFVLRGGRPQIPRDLSAAFRDLLTAGWNERTFGHNCEMFRNGELTLPRAKMEKFWDYVRKIDNTP
jgi:serine/threonine protein kinase